MLSTEKWDNWGKDSLLVRFTALTCDENRIFRENLARWPARNLWIKSTLLDLSSVGGSHV